MTYPPIIQALFWTHTQAGENIKSDITLIKSQPHILHFFDVVGCNKKMKILYKCVDYITYELSR
jgi:hypothetical protein